MDSHRAAPRRRPSRSSVLVGLVLAVLASVPVLVPLWVTRGPDAASAPAGLAAAPGVPALPRSVPGDSDPTGSTPLPPVGSLVPTPAGPTGTPTSRPAPATPATPATPAAPAVSRPAAPPAAPGPTTPVPSPAETSTAPPTTLIAQPDLVVTSVTWSPQVPTAGTPVTFTAVVRNAGTEATPQETHGIAFTVDDGTVTWSAASTTPLAPGEERSYTADGGSAGATWTATSGEHTVEAWADDAARIGETDDGNNTMSVRFTVA